MHPNKHRMAEHTIYEPLSGVRKNREAMSVNGLSGRFWHCNEETLALVDFLTSSTADIQDAFAYRKEAGHAAARRPDATDDITQWIAKAKQVQKRERPRLSIDESIKKEDKIEVVTNSSQQTLRDMKEEIDHTLQSYNELLSDIKLTSKKLERSKAVSKCGVLGVALLRLVPVGAVIAGVAFAFRGTMLPGMALAITGMVTTPFFWSCVIVTPEQEEQLVMQRNNVEDAITMLNSIHITVDQLIAFNPLSIDKGQTARGDVDTRLDILENLDNLEQVKENGKSLVGACNTMDLKFTELGNQIQVLRKQVVDLQHSRSKAKQG